MDAAYAKIRVTLYDNGRTVSALLYFKTQLDEMNASSL